MGTPRVGRPNGGAPDCRSGVLGDMVGSIPIRPTIQIWAHGAAGDATGLGPVFPKGICGFESHCAHECPCRQTWQSRNDEVVVPAGSTPAGGTR